MIVFEPMPSIPQGRTDRRAEERLTRLIALAGAASMLIARRAWSTRREVPLVPAFAFLDGAPELLHRCLFGASLLCAAVMFSRPRSRWPKALLLLCWLGLFAADVLRFQVWFYYWCLCLIALAAAPASEDGDEGLNTIRCMIAGLYL